ncbi:MAG TPA: NAD-dependent epimerase/dehydratase family protein [Candidatus Dormibacteraeota bacterium]|nr:NAD-dependent epimerase/dehydratase family protein [Candidatus Dormibacteraeota bacterium]
MSSGPILVTGGAGYIGSILVRLLLTQGERVRVVDRMLHGAHGLAELSQDVNLEVMQRDLRDPRAHGEILESVTTVIHLAAIVGDKACALDEELAVQTNWTATVALARSAAARGVKRFVFASTCSVYGEGRDEVLTEGSPVKPLSLYAETRWHAEQGLLEAAGLEQLEPILLRFGTVYGLSPRMRFDLVVNLLTLRAVSTGEVSIFGGTQWRPFVHVQDIVRALVTATTAPLPEGLPILNVGDNLENYQLRDLKEELESRIPGVRVSIVPEATDPRTYRVSFDRIEQLWGFRATKRVGDGIEEVARALRSGVIPDPGHRRYVNA